MVCYTNIRAVDLCLSAVGCILDVYEYRKAKPGNRFRESGISFV